MLKLLVMHLKRYMVNKTYTYGVIASLSSAIIFGISPIATMWIFAIGGTPLTVAFYRSTLSILPIAIYLKLRRVSLRIRPFRLVKIAAMTTLTMTLTSVLLLTSYKYIGVGRSTALHFLYPTAVVLIELIFFKAKLEKGKVVALALGIGGMVFLARGSQGDSLYGVVLAGLSAITYGLYLIGIEKMGLAKMRPMESMLYLNIGNTVGCLAVNIFMKDIVYSLSPKAFAFMAIVSFANCILAYGLLVYGINLIGASRAAIFSTFEPVSAIIGGIIIFGEKVTISNVLGSVLIIAAVISLIVFDKKEGVAG